MSHRDRILPKTFLHSLGFTQALHWSILASGMLCIIIYISTGANLSILSSMSVAVPSKTWPG